MTEGSDEQLPEPDRACFYEVNRTRLRAWQWGDPTAPPVLLSHGAHDHGRMFDDFAPRIAALGFHAVAIDVRGHGDSGRVGSGMAWSAATVDICELARVLAAEAGRPGEPIGLIGHSMGGGQVLSAAGTVPERIAWVVVLDGLGPPHGAFEEPTPVEAATRSVDRIVKVLGRPPRVWASRTEMAERRGQTNVRLPRRFLRHLVEHGSVETGGPEGGAGFVWKADPIFNTGLPDGFSVEMIMESFRDVTVPVLALVGTEEDGWSELPAAEVERRIAILPDARWHPVPGAGHYVHVEQPQFCLDRIIEFLAELGVSAAVPAEVPVR